MKKLVFAAIAATFVFVSVSNAVANNKIESTSVAPTDSVAPADTTIAQGQTATNDAPLQMPADSATVAE